MFAFLYPFLAFDKVVYSMLELGLFFFNLAVLVFLLQCKIRNSLGNQAEQYTHASCWLTLLYLVTKLFPSVAASGLTLACLVLEFCLCQELVVTDEKVAVCYKKYKITAYRFSLTITKVTKPCNSSGTAQYCHIIKLTNILFSAWDVVSLAKLFNQLLKALLFQHITPAVKSMGAWSYWLALRSHLMLLAYPAIFASMSNMSFFYTFSRNSFLAYQSTVFCERLLKQLRIQVLNQHWGLTLALTLRHAQACLV